MNEVILTVNIVSDQPIEIVNVKRLIACVQEEVGDHPSISIHTQRTTDLNEVTLSTEMKANNSEQPKGFVPELLQQE